jgi:glycerol uptake facilitator-like aquaporin
LGTYFDYCGNTEKLQPLVPKKEHLEQIARYADMLSAMGTDSRLRIMQLLLSTHPEGLIVGEIGNELEIPSSTLSHHLEKLKNEDLVKVRRDGTFLWYSAKTSLSAPLFERASPQRPAARPVAAPENCLLFMTLSRRIVAEGLGTAFLLAVVVGSGIMGEKLAGGNIAIALLGNTLATGAMLIALIFTFGPISGAHFNPAVTVGDASQGGISWSDAPAYIAAQVSGAFIGVAAAHIMFGQSLLQVSHHARAGGGQLFSEFIATFGLLCVILGCARLRSEAVPVAIGLYITGAYWFTASTSFANPTVTPPASPYVLRSVNSEGPCR